MIIVSLIINVILIIIEMYVLLRLRNKKEIFKYYTYLHNLLCLIVSIVFSVFIINNLLFDSIVPEYVRGLRYVVSTGLVFTSIIYIMFLTSNKNNMISDKDFKGISGKKVNLLLHYVCPLLSLFSFIFFERNIIVNNGIWTLLVAIPSCLYWIIYLILSILKLWDKPYDFSDNQGKKSIIFVLVIPLVFILVSFVLWNVR